MKKAHVNKNYTDIDKTEGWPDKVEAIKEKGKAHKSEKIPNIESR